MTLKVTQGHQTAAIIQAIYHFLLVAHSNNDRSLLFPRCYHIYSACDLEKSIFEKTV